MSIPTSPPPAKLLASIIYRPGHGRPDTAVAELEKRFGAVDFSSAELAFTQTDYYNREMGADLMRRFISFAELVERDRLVDIKLATNAEEKHYLDADGNRTLNLDPGLLTPENLILATGKNFSHRVYLRAGIFAEVTLLYQHRRFVTLPWTYPDYASGEILDILTELRQRLLAELRRHRPSSPAP